MVTKTPKIVKSSKNVLVPTSTSGTEGYLPLEHFQTTDDDHSTVRIRDMQ